jgi:hypothetical protein
MEHFYKWPLPFVALIVIEHNVDWSVRWQPFNVSVHGEGFCEGGRKTFQTSST